MSRRATYGLALLVASCAPRACGESRPVPAVEVEGDAVEFRNWHLTEKGDALVVDMLRTGDDVDRVEYVLWSGETELDRGVFPGNIFQRPGEVVTRQLPQVHTFHADGRLEYAAAIRDVTRVTLRTVVLPKATGPAVPEHLRLTARACEGGALDSCFDLVSSLLGPNDRSPESERAAAHYRRVFEQGASRACEANDGGGCYMLGRALVVGDVLPEDRARGGPLLRRACALGAPLACMQVREWLDTPAP